MQGTYIEIVAQRFRHNSIYLHALHHMIRLQTDERVSVAARSKAYVCGRSPAGVVGLHPTGGHERLSVMSVVCC